MENKSTSWTRTFSSLFAMLSAIAVIYTVRWLHGSPEAGLVMMVGYWAWRGA